MGPEESGGKERRSGREITCLSELEMCVEHAVAKASYFKNANNTRLFISA